MTANWSFGQKLTAGFTSLLLLACFMAVVAVNSLSSVIDASDRLVSVYGENLIDANRLATWEARKVVELRGYILSPDEAAIRRAAEAREQFLATLERMRKRASSDTERELLQRCEAAESEHQLAADKLTRLRQSQASLASVADMFRTEVAPRRVAIARAIDDLENHQHGLREGVRKESAGTAARAQRSVLLALGALAGLGGLLAYGLTRSMRRQIGSAVAQVQSSSAELQAVANQQATGAREQATAMSEIATTITELLSTARQISESAQRVSAIAEQTAHSAGSGDTTVEKTGEIVLAMRRQVDAIVHHMMELGKKSQQIGAVLDVVSELAEQTNILAINATIEAAGAGEAGKRFGVVADEIRKLADRVTSSSKQTRALIEDVRNTVNTTVMATETGSKSVESAALQFAELAASFRQIAALVTNTTEASREIELSTKQQSSAVEQVNVGIANILQATRENESSTQQTLQTASQLARLSDELVRLVQAGQKS
jgi:methyl-accepting chemotaxis protein